MEQSESRQIANKRTDTNTSDSHLEEYISESIACISIWKILLISEIILIPFALIAFIAPAAELNFGIVIFISIIALIALIGIISVTRIITTLLCIERTILFIDNVESRSILREGKAILTYMMISIIFLFIPAINVLALIANGILKYCYYKNYNRTKVQNEIGGTKPQEDFFTPTDCVEIVRDPSVLTNILENFQDKTKDLIRLQKLTSILCVLEILLGFISLLVEEILVLAPIMIIFGFVEVGKQIDTLRSINQIRRNYGNISEINEFRTTLIIVIWTSIISRIAMGVLIPLSISNLLLKRNFYKQGQQIENEIVQLQS